MKVVFRADASVEIGSGHVMRCLTLADELRSAGADVVFVCRDLLGAMFELLQSRSYSTVKLPCSAGREFSQEIDAEETIKAIKQFRESMYDWVVVDHYSLGSVWEQKLRQYAEKIMVIDDLANRPHECDILLDQNLYSNAELRYNGLLPISCSKMLGPDFALLRPEFLEARQKKRQHRGFINRILVFFGGSDPSNETEKALIALEQLNHEVMIDVVVGSNNPNVSKIKHYCDKYSNTLLHYQINNMAELMADADLSLGAGGSATWERCVVGLPAVVISVAHNQIAISQGAAAEGVQIDMGVQEEVTATDLLIQVQKLFETPELLVSMSEKACALVDGLGCKRVADVMRQFI